MSPDRGQRLINHCEVFNNNNNNMTGLRNVVQLSIDYHCVSASVFVNVLLQLH